MVGYVAFLLTTRRVKTTGPTPYQHIRGRQLVNSFLCSGERCLWELREKGPAREEDGKLQPRWKRGISLEFFKKDFENFAHVENRYLYAGTHLYW